MAVKRCFRCGANVPDGAEFCPSCGAPKGAKAIAQPMDQPVAQPPQPMYQQPMYQQPMYQQPMVQSTPLYMQKVSPVAWIFDMFFSKTGVIFGVGLGILLAWVGVLVGTFTDGHGDAAQFLFSTGFAAMGLVLAAGGIWNNRIESHARLGMVLIGGYILCVGLSAANGLLGALLGKI